MDDNNLFMQMFKHAETVALEEFTDDDLKQQDVLDSIVTEGVVKAFFGDIYNGIVTDLKQMEGWFQGIKEKQANINGSCKALIEWLKEKDREYPKLSLDMGSFKTWMKTSEFYIWRYYYLLNDGVFNEIMKNIKNNQTTALEVSTNFDLSDRSKVTRMLDSAMTIKDLMVIVEKYRSRADSVFNAMLKRERKIQSFPFQIMLLGFADLNTTVKKIIHLAE